MTTLADKTTAGMGAEHRADGWWIVNTPPGVDEMGPYETKREADEDRVGVQRWIKQNMKAGA